MKRIRPLALLFFFLLSSQALADKVTEVLDGETLRVAYGRRSETIKLYGIGCPKLHSFGEMAKKFTSGLTLEKEVRIERISTDQDGNLVANVYVGEALLNEELIKAGFAWVNSASCHDTPCQKWKELEQAAKDEHRGLWVAPSN